jgi:hypothetical protein
MYDDGLSESRPEQRELSYSSSTRVNEPALDLWVCIRLT